MPLGRPISSPPFSFPRLRNLPWCPYPPRLSTSWCPHPPLGSPFDSRPRRQIEIVKQAGSATYVKKFECPVLEAYKAYDAIMSGRLDNKHRE